MKGTEYNQIVGTVNMETKPGQLANASIHEACEFAKRNKCDVRLVSNGRIINITPESDDGDLIDKYYSNNLPLGENCPNYQTEGCPTVCEECKG